MMEIIICLYVYISVPRSSTSCFALIDLGLLFILPKQVMPKSEDLSRSLEIKPISTFDTELPTIFNKSCTYITFKSAVKHGQLLVLHDIRCRKSQSANETDIGPGPQSSRSRSTHCCRS